MHLFEQSRVQTSVASDGAQPRISAATALRLFHGVNLQRIDVAQVGRVIQVGGRCPDVLRAGWGCVVRREAVVQPITPTTARRRGDLKARVLLGWKKAQRKCPVRAGLT